jgi:hypothetical protein
MLVSGILTCTMIFAVISPDAARKNTFGESLSGPVANIVVRNWGALIALIGLMLVYAAFHPASRKLVAVVAASSKLIWCGLVVVLGSQFLSKAGIVIGFDLVVATILLLHVFASESDEAKHPRH